MSDENSEELETNQVSILIADVKDYSKLKPYQLQIFFSEVIPEINKQLEENEVKAKNSWGDGIFGIFRDPKSAARASLAIRDWFRQHPWDEMGLPELSIRIAVHVGTVYEGYNSIRGEQGVVGTNINLTARMEPITVPNHVFVSDIFKKNIEAEIGETSFEFDPFPEQSLAKEWGEETLHHLRRDDDPRLTPDDIPSSEDERVSPESEAHALESFFNTGSLEDQFRAVDILANKGTIEAISILAEKLNENSTRGEVRRRIAGRLGEIEDKRVTEPLLEVIDESEQYNVVNNSLTSLRRLAEKGVIGAEILDDLEDILLKDEDYPDRFRMIVAEIMGEFEDHRVVDPLIEVLSNSEGTNASVRARAARSLSKQGPSAAVDSLIKALSDPNPQVRVDSITGLGEIGSPKAVEPLTKVILDDEEAPQVRIRATDALEEIADPPATDLLANVMEISNPAVRGAAIFMIGDLQVEDLLSEIEKTATDDQASQYERKMSINAIAKIGSSSSTATIESLIKESDDDLRLTGIESLGSINSQEARQILTEVVTDEENYLADERSSAAIALREQGQIEAIDSLIESADDSKWQVRKSSIEALAAIGGIKAQNKLINIVEDKEGKSQLDRSVAAWQLRKAEDGYKATERLLTLLKEEPNSRVVRNAIDALGVLGRTKAAESVVDFALDESLDRDFRKSALFTLALIGDPIAESPAKEVAYDDSNPIGLRSLALLTLGTLDTPTANEILQDITINEDMAQTMRIRAQQYLAADKEELKSRIENIRDDALEDLEANFDKR